ncbi:integral membrane sensor signal transduction histidine kinase [Desulfovibrio sp. X2]|uniref:sensor histidine kinase n=1 Tax=Desulfovibrio sp. X2 TaxID=941449 RepID=UPI00035893EC|nr:ATP-binding protein [Desulfovibrio sp. X2]EPR41970.1 integral membrane sensor signal transduction histidine kinase [Desulfovibrio sp. X2]
MTQTASSNGTFQTAKVLSMTFFVLLLGSNLVLSIFLSDYARRTLLEKQKDYALLLADNLNHQIFQRFTLPTVLAFGKVDLKDPRQLERLDQIVRTTMHGFHVLDLRIYGFERRVVYSMNDEGKDAELKANQVVDQALDKGTNHFLIATKRSEFASFFALKTEPEDVTMQTVYALRADRRLNPNDPRGPITGALEFTQDISKDYERVITFERIIVGATTFTALTLFFILLVILRRADRLAAERAAEKERFERELHQTEKLASMGRMVAGVAHEIRNPLGIIRSTAELLLQKAKAENPAGANAKLLTAIFDESKRLSRTVNDFLDYARPKHPRQDDVDVGKVLNQVAVFMEQKCRDQEVALERQFAEGLHIKGDADLLYRAIYNLVANALDAMAGPGSIRLAAGADEAGLTLVVSDTGPGFPAETLDHVKDPFFTTKENGTGLGLAIVDTIIQGHGGVMDLGNNEGGGARVTITFPKE